MALKIMGEKEEDSIITVREICDALKTPFDTTAKVMQAMNHHGIVKSIQGLRGGYTLHKNLSDITCEDGAIDTLFQLKNEGCVSLVGLAMGKVEVMYDLIQKWPFDVMINHNRFTLLNRQADKLFDFAKKRGIKIFNAAPFCGGILAKGTKKTNRLVYQEVSEKKLKPILDLENICLKYNVPLGAAALQFSMKDTRITSTIVGITKKKRIDEISQWSSFKIPKDAWTEILSLPFATNDPEEARNYKLG